MWVRALCAAALVLSGAAAAAQTVTSITGARYIEPTSAYPHGVLGDEEEWAAIEITVRTDRGKEGDLLHTWREGVYRIAALDYMVYEDTEPRLWDITGDGLPEVVAVKAHQQYGAQLVIIGLVEGELTYIASTPTIGTRFRWLAPVGAADMDGDGHIEIGFVDRPHLAKTLRVWRYTPDSFAEVAQLAGLSNHRIGEDYITGGLRDCGQGPQMIVADGNWRNIMSVELGAAGLTATPIAPFDGRASVDAQLGCP